MGKLGPKTEPGVDFEIARKKSNDGSMESGLTGGAIASQAFARLATRTTTLLITDPNEASTNGPGVLARLRYIDETLKGDGLRVAAYEFTRRFSMPQERLIGSRRSNRLSRHHDGRR